MNNSSSGSGSGKPEVVDVFREAGIQRSSTVRPNREFTRLVIVVSLFLVFGITIVWAFANSESAYWNNTKDLLDLLLPAETALIGTAVAFYMSAPPTE